MERQKTRTLNHTSATTPQRHFWASDARFRLFVGGVGSGKTRAGVLEILRQPAASTGMVAAPTYTMLRDATLHTFLELTQRGGVLSSFNKSEMTATLVDGKRVLFRSADEPDRLRGPNLGWFYLDEAALMVVDTWLIMMGRLREAPGRAWATSTPRGFNWLYETFTHGGAEYATVQSSTRENVFLPPSFVASLEQAYPSDWQQQEIEGAFIEPSGALLKRSWFHVVDHAPEGLRWARYWDLATSTRESADYTASAAQALGGDGTLYIRDMVRGRWEWPDARRVIVQTMQAEDGVMHAIEEAMHGLAAIQDLRRDPSLVRIALRGVRVDKDKMTRALPWAARAEAGKVALVRGPWIEAFLAEVCSFPHGAHDDQVDTVSGGVELLSPGKTNSAVGAFAAATW